MLRLIKVKEILKYCTLVVLFLAILIASPFALYAQPGTEFDAIPLEDMSATEAYIQDRYDASVEILEPLVNANIANWVNGADEGLFRYGNPAASTLRDSIDSDWLQSPQTFMCNINKNTFTPHTFDDLHEIPDYSTCNLPNCGCLRIEYPAGYVSGHCFYPIPVVYPCFGIFWIWADMVEYLFPTLKVNASEQLFQSRYLDIADVIPQMIETETLLQNVTFRALVPYQHSLVQAGLAQNLSPLPAPFTPASFAPPFLTDDDIYSSNQVTYDESVGLLNNDPTPVSDWLQSPSGWKGYGRVWNEPEILRQSDGSDSWLWMPHWHACSADKFGNCEADQISMDIDQFDMSWWLSNADDPSDHISDPLRCSRNNQETGRTGRWVQALNPARWGPANYPDNINDPEDLICLPNIGEIEPRYAYRRPTRSDGTMQSFFRIIKDWADNRDEFSERQSMRLRQDNFHILPDWLGDTLNAKLKEDIPNTTFSGADEINNCDDISNFLVPNHNYIETNMRDDSDDDPYGSEATVEIFTWFKGCYGMKLAPPVFQIPFPPFATHPDYVRLW